MIMEIEILRAAATTVFYPSKSPNRSRVALYSPQDLLADLERGSKLYLDALIELVLDNEGNPINRITAWLAKPSKPMSIPTFPVN
jgi:hypothetical protein